MRRGLLFLTFFGLCLGLGYPSLNRVAPGAGGLDDIPHYIDMVRFEYDDVEAPFRYRVLVPTLAGGIVALLDPVPLGSWHREMFGLLLVNAALTAAAALLILQTARASSRPPAEALVAALVFLASFNVANAYLVGFVDPVEVLTIAACAWLTLTGRTVWLIPLFPLAALGKETAVAFGALFSLVAIAGENLPRARVHWVLGVVLALLATVAVRAALGSDSLLQDLWTYRKSTPLLERVSGILSAKTLVYTFAVPLALALPSLGTIPARLKRGALAAAALALVAAAAAGIEDNVSRPLFSCAAPLLCIASAATLVRFVGPRGGPDSGGN